MKHQLKINENLEKNTIEVGKLFENLLKNLKVFSFLRSGNNKIVEASRGAQRWYVPWTNKLYRHQSIWQLFLKIDLQEYFPALICHPSRRKCIHLQTGWWDRRGWRKTQKLPQKVSVSNDTFALSSLYMISEWCLPRGGGRSWRGSPSWGRGPPAAACPAIGPTGSESVHSMTTFCALIFKL